MESGFVFLLASGTRL